MINRVRIPGYNYDFNTETGNHIRWGFDLQDDPQWSPIGPEILDIEVSEICHGGCKFCYKSNTGSGKNMSLETFTRILDKLPMLTQIAFGIGDIDGNPDLFAMFDLCRSRGVVPNLTINSFRMMPYHYDELARLCGAVAVSLYDRDSTYNAVKELTDRGMKQVNIHALVSLETLPLLAELSQDVKTDPRLEKLNAVVFLSLKQRGRGTGYHPLPGADYAEFMNRAVRQMRCGFDSCSAHKFLRSIQSPLKERVANYVEPCESGLFSAYINSEGRFFACSFTEDGVGIDVANCRNFLEDVWYHPDTIAWRRKLLACQRNCPVYAI